MKLEFNYNDGGRSQYFKGEARDCVVRAIAIAMGKDYKETYDMVADFLGYTPRNGVKHNDTKRVMKRFGFKWFPTMSIGTGCRVHMAQFEIPMEGRIICNLSGHVAAVIDGVLNDNHDCTRDGKRCVYGYWFI